MELSAEGAVQKGEVKGYDGIIAKQTFFHQSGGVL